MSPYGRVGVIYFDFKQASNQLLLQCLIDFLDVRLLVQHGGHVAARRRAALRRGRRVAVVVADVLLVPQVQGEVDDALLRVKVLLL